MDKLYKALEEKFRGDKKNVKEKLKTYLPILQNVDKNNKIIDIGCGRGEFLELLKEEGYKNLIGIDINKEMLKNIKYKDIKIIIEDGIEFLKKQPANSTSVISSFHMIEHIEFKKILNFIKEAFRVLDKNGILIIETPNPENLKVASENFYLDYTHLKPIPMELLKFIVEYVGFKAKILRLNHSKIGNSIKDIIYGVSPDYAVIGFKNEKMINENFFKNGISLDLALFAFEERMKNLEERMKNMELKVENENLKIENEKLKIIIDNLKNENNNLKNENSNLKNENSNLKNENNNLKNENSNLKNENNNLKNENSNLKNENSNLKNENNNLKNHIDHLNNENIRLKQEIEHLNKLYNEIINSKSWKITKPLRKITNFFRKKKRNTVLNITALKDQDLNLSPRAKEIYEDLKKEIKGKK